MRAAHRLSRNCEIYARALERVNRALRQKARQVGTFHAARGLTAAVVLVIVHRGVTMPTRPQALWAEGLEAGLLAV